MLTLMSCQPGAPVVTVIGQVSGFSINESIQNLKNKSNRSIFAISGKCNPSITDIEISFDGGSSYSLLSSVAETSTKDCTGTGTFNYIINPNTVTAFNLPLESSFKDFKIRGYGDYGMTNVLNLRRMVSSDFQVTTGSASVTSGGAILRGRILSTIGRTSGVGFMIKGTLRVK